MYWLLPVVAASVQVPEISASFLLTLLMFPHTHQAAHLP